MTADSHGPWLELERAALHELATAWKDINWSHLGNRLLPPAFELSAGESALGQWHRQRRLISMSRKLVFEQPWGVVEEVLKHEMAHQFADEIWNARDETAHGPAFRLACEQLAIDPAASGLPEVPLDDADQRMIQKVARLLSLASSPNQHEAEAATLAARKLMLKHNIDAQQGARRAYGFKHLGTPARRLEESTRVLGRILGEHFFVEVIWVRSYRALDRVHGTVLEICGTPSNLAIAEYVYAYLQHAANELWTAHGEKKGRLRFQAGVMYGFLEKLERDKKQAPATEQGLVWVKDGELDRYYHRRHPRITTMRRDGNTRDKTFEHGREAGRSITLKRGIEGNAPGRGRLLGSGEK